MYVLANTGNALDGVVNGSIERFVGRVFVVSAFACVEPNKCVLFMAETPFHHGARDTCVRRACL